MNRREWLKGAAASALVAGVGTISGYSSSPRLSQTQALTQTRTTRSEPCASEIDPTLGIRVLFHGLWAFWIGYQDPAGTAGVLAFTPVIQQHVQTANIWQGAEIAVLDGLSYSVDVQSNAVATLTDLKRRIGKHNVGIQIPANVID